MPPFLQSFPMEIVPCWAIKCRALPNTAAVVYTPLSLIPVHITVLNPGLT